MTVVPFPRQHALPRQEALRRRCRHPVVPMRAKVRNRGAKAVGFYRMVALYLALSLLGFAAAMLLA